MILFISVIFRIFIFFISVLYVSWGVVSVAAESAVIS